MDKPLLRVSREVAACSQCRSAKIKCDGQLPVCGACKKAGKDRDCIAPGGDFAKGAERTYVNFLESRIERMERELAQRRRHQRSAVVIQPTARKLDTAQKHEAGNVNNFVSTFGLLSVNATSRDFNGFNKEMSFARLIMSTCCLGQYPIETMHDLPLKDVTIGWLRECLRTWLTIYPILTETDIMASLERVYGRAQDTACDQWNLRLTLAIIILSRSSSKGDASSMQAVGLATSALKYAEDCLQPGSIPAIQSLVLLILYSLLNPSHFSCWYLMGIVTRLCVDIGLHQDPSDDLTVHHPTNELRRRVFHCVYALERIITITQIRAFSILDEAIDVELPSATITPYMAFEEQEAAQTQPGAQNISRFPSSPALDLLKMRMVESSWYQCYFGATQQVKSQPWYERYNGITEIRNTITQLPPSTPDALKLMLMGESDHNTILLISPPGQEQQVDQYGKALVFDAAVEFANVLRDRSHMPNAMCTHLEITQALFVGSRLLAILKDKAGFLYTTESPKIPPAAPDALLPPIRRRLMVNNIEEGKSALMALVEALDRLEPRFGSSAGVTFRREAFQVKQNLDLAYPASPQTQQQAYSQTPVLQTTMAAQAHVPYVPSAGNVYQSAPNTRDGELSMHAWAPPALPRQ